MTLSALFVALLCCFWPLRLLRYYAGFVTLFCGWLILGFYSSVSTQLLPNPRTGIRISGWWFAVTLPASLVIISVVGGTVTRASGFRSFEVPSTAMEPTIQRGDHIVADFRAYRGHMPQYRDVIIFYRNGTYFIKRVVGMGGDTVEGRDGSIYINGILLNESYAQHSQAGLLIDSQASSFDWMQNFGPAKVTAGKYFVLGDNRDVSLDSRSPEFGMVDGRSVLGKVLYVFSAGRDGFRIR